VLREPQGRGGSAWIHDHVRSGDRLKVRGPRNHFRLDETPSRVIFVAGGIGITPISAMAARAKALGIAYELHYSGRQRRTMALLEPLYRLHGERLHVYAGDEGRRNDLGALLADPDPDVKVYACGPARMLQALEVACAAWPEDSLRIEHFESRIATLDPTRERPFQVELKDSGIVLDVAPGQTVLQVLRAANIDIQSDCEEGLCGSCEVRVLAGEVDHRDVVLTRSERHAHAKMMTCCSRARSSRLILEL